MTPPIVPVATTHAPEAVGPYSQAVRAGNMLFLSGQIPLDPATGALVQGGFEAETRRVLNNLRAVVEAAGGTMASVVKTTVFMTDLSQFQTMNSIYAEYFGAAPPARSTIQVAALPKGVSIEIEAIAVISEQT